MAVVIETTLGDITVDLYLDQRPVTCLNFLKLCKMKYYNFNLFHSIRSGFIAQTGDPSGEGSGGQSIFGVLEGPEKRFFSGEKMPKIRHTDVGLLSMVGTGDMMIGSQFFFTLGSDLDSLDGMHCVIGEITEGHDVLRKLNDVICDEGHRPYRDVRITHTVVLEDPFNDPPGLRAPSRSPSPSAERLKGGRIAPDEEIDETLGKSAAEIQEMIEEKEAKARATILEIVGDLPDADIAPPENVLFVCKLNPVTTDDDLEIIFSRFGKIVSCEVIRDKKSGDSLQYAFIEFGDKKSCEDAYFKMDNVLIDDRRIHVDFSQSVSKMKWLGKGRGVKYFNDEEGQGDHVRNEKPRQSRNDVRDNHNNRNHYNNSRRHDDREKERDRDQRSDRHQRYEKDSKQTQRYDKESNYRHEKSTNNKYERDSSDRRENISSNRYEKESNRYEKSSNNKYERESNNKYEKSSNNRHEKDHNDRHERHSSNKCEKESNNKTDERSLRRRSQSKSRQERPRNDSDKYSNDHNNSQESEKTVKEYKNESRRQEIEENQYNSNAHRSKSSPSRQRTEKSRDHKNKQEHDERKSENTEKHRDGKMKRKHEDLDAVKSKRFKKDSHIIEPRTPTPTGDRKKKSISKNNRKKTEKRKRSTKKKRKPSTSSSDSSSDSSSSSESSSSDEDRKKKSKRRRKKKYSTSSSSSESSSSSSSSSTETSSSSSSSSEDDKKKKRKKKSRRK